MSTSGEGRPRRPGSACMSGQRAGEAGLQELSAPEHSGGPGHLHRSRPEGPVTFEMHPKDTPPGIFKKFSLWRGKQNFRVCTQDKRDYPWDGSGVKSVGHDLKRFEKLDACAMAVDVTSSVEELVRVLLKDAHTKLEKVRAIWIWVCYHIEYDTRAYYNIFARSSDANFILRKRKGVCAGYAALFQRMCRVAEIQCVQIVGYAKGHSYRIGQRFLSGINHAWNAVHLDGTWHLLDSTWGAGNVNDNYTQFHFAYNEFYFLTHPAIFIEDHFPDKKEWQLLNTPLSKKQYERNTRHHNTFYSMELLTSSPRTAVTTTVNGKVVVVIEGRSPTLFTFTLNGAEKPGVLSLKDHGMQLEVFPQATGRHKLQIFAKPPSSSDRSANVVLEYIVTCRSVDRNMQIPKTLDFSVGGKWCSEVVGCVQPSHTDPIIYSPNGRCAVSLKLKKAMDIYATLHDVAIAKHVDNRHIFKRQWEDNVELQIQLPQAGSYALRVFAKVTDGTDKDYANVCNYLLYCTNASVTWPVFPLRYTSWLDCYELVEPTVPTLPANSSVHFKLKAPGVDSLFIQHKGRCPLRLGDDGYSELYFDTAGCRDVALMAQSASNKTCLPLLYYQVEAQ